MDFLEILSNFWAAFAILAAVGIGYVLFVTRHSYSEKAKDAFQSHLKGCIVDGTVWFAILAAALALGTQNLKAQWIFEQVIGTKILNVPLIMWSMVFVPITFSVHSAHKRFDYRAPAVGILLAIALVCGIYYWITVPVVPAIY